MFTVEGMFVSDESEYHAGDSEENSSDMSGVPLLLEATALMQVIIPPLHNQKQVIQRFCRHQFRVCSHLFRVLIQKIMMIVLNLGESGYWMIYIMRLMKFI